MSWTIRVYTDLDSARDQWESFFATTSTSSLMMTWQFASLWWKTYGSRFTPYIVSVTDEQQQGLIAPLMRQGSKLMWLATPDADSLSFLYNAPDKLPAAIRAFADHLKQINWAQFHVRYLHKPQTDLLLEALNLPYTTVDDTVAPTVFHKGRTWEQYWESLSPKFRSDVRRKHRKIESDGLRISFEMLHDPNAIAGYFPTIREIVNAGNIPDKIEMLKGQFWFDVWRQYAECGWLELNLCFLNDEVAAYSLNYVINGAGSGMSVGYRAAYRDYAPGKLLVEYVLRNSFERGDKIFDMQHGPDEYKLTWTDEEQPLNWLTLYPTPMQKNLAKLKKDVKRSVKKLLKKA